MRVIEGPQYTDEWWRVRRGIPTASEFGAIITPAKGEMSKQAIGYVCQLIADRYDPAYGMQEDYVSAAMKNGTDAEPDARRTYEMLRDVDVHEVCFCVTDDGRIGASPDGLVGDDGVLELKCPQPKTQVQYLVGGELPAAYRPQVHGHLVVTGRAWCDFMSYSPGLPPLLLRVTPDDYTAKLRAALAEFLELYDETLQSLDLPDPPKPAEREEITNDDLPAALAH